MKTQLTDHDSVEQILCEMTVEEKARMIIGGSPFHTEAIPEYGIPAMYMIDSCNGLNSLEYAGEKIYAKIASDANDAGQPLDREKNNYMGGLLIALGALKQMSSQQSEAGVKPAPKEYNCYPPGIAMGATWNPEVIEACGSALAKEMNGYGIDMILGPNVNIQRDPLCGRLGESFTEDPFLMSRLAPALIRGIQKEGVISCAKHFAANNQEKDRMGVEEHISERALREIYFPGFQACVDAGCKTIMSAYNKINGTPSAMNQWLLTDILRSEWNFKGFVVSDWGAAYDHAAAAAAGNDLTMPGPRGIQQIQKALDEGTLTTEKLNECVRNILHVIVDSTAMSGHYPAFSQEKSIEAIENVLRESMILLKNDGTLPLSMDSHVAFYGKRSKKFTLCPAGSSNVDTDLGTNPYERTMELIGSDHVTFNESTSQTRYWIVVVGADGREGADREHLHMDEDDCESLKKAILEAEAANGKVILVINATGPIDFIDYEDKINAVLCPFLPGSRGGKICADAIFGLFNPSGKLALTWPRHLHDCPAYKNFGGENKEVWYSEGIYVGYRWYDARHIEPFYPFGYGQSYTTFEINNVRVPEKINVDLEDIPVQFTVKNTRSMAGSEVVQIYIHDEECKFDRPEKELKGFCKTYLEPGEEKTETIFISKKDLSGFCTEFGEWVTQPGQFTILVGTSARDIIATQTILVQCKDPFGLSGKTSIGELVKNHKAVEIVNHIMEEDIHILAHVALDFAPDKSFQELWNGTNIQGTLKKKGWDKELICKKYQQIMEEFDRL